MALPLPVGSPVGALLATSLTRNGERGVFPGDSALVPVSHPRLWLLEVET